MRSVTWPQKSKKPFSFADWKKRILAFAIAILFTLIVWYGGWYIYTVASIWSVLPNYVYGFLLLVGVGVCWFNLAKDVYLHVSFVRNLTIQVWSKLPHRNPFKKQETVSNIPKSWITSKGKPKSSTAQQYVVVAKPKKKKRFRIPGWLMFKRILAIALACFWFFLGQATLLGSTQTMGFYVFFMLTCYILLDYVWKTRRPPQLFEEVKS